MAKVMYEGLTLTPVCQSRSFESVSVPEEVPESGLHVASYLSLEHIVPYPARISREGRASAGMSIVYMGMDSHCVFQH